MSPIRSGNTLAARIGVEVGQQLFEARQRRGLALDDISRATKIPVSVLSALERNDASHLPQPFFTRAFVRAYAKEVGVNADELFDCEDLSDTAKSAPDILSANAAVAEPASPLSFFFVALAAAGSIYYGYSLQLTSSVASQTAPAQMVLPSEPVAQSARGDIMLTARTVITDVPVAPSPLVVKAEVSAPVAATDDAATVEGDAQPIFVEAESSPVVSDAIAPQPEPVPAAGPVEQF